MKLSEEPLLSASHLFSGRITQEPSPKKCEFIKDITISHAIQFKNEEWFPLQHRLCQAKMFFHVFGHNLSCNGSGFKKTSRLTFIEKIVLELIKNQRTRLKINQALFSHS